MEESNTRHKKKIKLGTDKEEKDQDCVLFYLDKEIRGIILSMVGVFFFEAFKRTSKQFMNILELYIRDNPLESNTWDIKGTFLYNERNARVEYIRWAIENKVLKISNHSIRTIAVFGLVDMLKMIIEDYTMVGLEKEKQMTPYEGVPKIMSAEEHNQYSRKMILVRSILIDAPKTAAENGHLPIIKYIDDVMKNKENESSHWTMYDCRMWNPFLRTFGIHTVEKSYIEIAAYYGHIHILEWALENGYIDMGNIMIIGKNAAKGGQLEVIKWLDDHDCLLGRSYLIQGAITSDSAELFKWIKERFEIEISEMLSEISLRKNNKNIKEYIKEQGYKTT